MTLSHMHLLLSHFPTASFIIALTLVIVARIVTSVHVEIGGLVVMVLSAIVAVPAYVTGNAAAMASCGTANGAGLCADGVTSQSLLDQHEGAALLALVLMVVTGGLAWLGLWQWRRVGTVSRWNTSAILMLGLLTSTTVVRAAVLGNEIRYPEIRVTADTTVTQLGRVAADVLSTTPLTWPAAETLHVLGLTLLLGVLSLLGGKVLGVVSTVTYDAVDRLLPWAIVGFGLSIITSMLFLAATPSVYIGSAAFYYKLTFTLLAAAFMVVYTFDPTWAYDADRIPRRTKVLAGMLVLLWIGVMYEGSVLIGNAF